jgi:hypothetical protein
METTMQELQSAIKGFTENFLYLKEKVFFEYRNWIANCMSQDVPQSLDGHTAS